MTADPKGHSPSLTNKSQQMRWSRATVQPFLDVRTDAVLNDTLEHVFCRRHLGFRPANDDRRPTATAAR